MTYEQEITLMRKNILKNQLDQKLKNEVLVRFKQRQRMHYVLAEMLLKMNERSILLNKIKILSRGTRMTRSLTPTLTPKQKNSRKGIPKLVRN
jgi:hypothetical protein